MKKLLTTIALLFSLSLACDLPFEEVGGIKIGCPVSSVDWYENIPSSDQKYSADFKNYEKTKKLENSFFDTVTVHEHDGIVAGALFFKYYKINSDNQKSIMAKMTKDAREFASALAKWGIPGGRKSEELLKESPSGFADASDNIYSFQEFLDEAITISPVNSDVLGFINMQMIGLDENKKLSLSRNIDNTVGFGIAYLDHGSLERLNKNIAQEKKAKTDGF